MRSLSRNVHLYPTPQYVVSTSMHPSAQPDIAPGLIETCSSEVLSTLSRALDAVGLVTGQPVAVGGDKGIDEVLQLSDAR
jgi:hypothetical protein